MQFNPSSGFGLIQDCEQLTGLGKTGISGDTDNLAQFTSYINSWYHKAVTMILASQDDWDWDDSNRTNYPIGTAPLEAAKRDYTFPTSLKMLKMKRVDVSYDGTNYVQAIPIDSVQLPVAGASEDSYFTTSQPGYDVRANGVFLYPKPTASTGYIRIEYLREPVEFTVSDTSAEPGFDEPFHRILSIGASFDYCQTYQKPIKNDLWTMLQDYEARLKEFYSNKNIKRARFIPRASNYE